MGYFLHRWSLDDATLVNASIASAGGGYPRRIVPSKPYIASWRLDENDVVFANQQSGGSMFAVGNVTPRIATPINYGVTQQNGGYVYAGHNALYNTAYGSPFSAACWCAANVSGLTIAYHRILSKLDLNSVVGWELILVQQVEGSYILVQLLENGAAGLWRVFGLLPDDLSVDTAWHHVAFTWTGAQNSNGITVYWDGQSVATANQDLVVPAGGSLATSTPLYVGVLTGNQDFFPGSFADVVLSNTVLTQQNIDDLIASGPFSNSSAMWSHTFTEDTNARLISVPGNLAAPHADQVSIVVNNEAPVTSEANEAIDVAIGANQTVDVTVNLDVGEYIGDPNGAGPAILYDGVPPVSVMNLSAVKSPPRNIIVGPH